MATESYLQQANYKPAGELVNSPLWQDIKRCLNDRRPPFADAIDEPGVAAAKGHQRAGFERCIQEIEKLPFDISPSSPAGPFERPAMDTAD